MFDIIAADERYGLLSTIDYVIAWCDFVVGLQYVGALQQGTFCTSALNENGKPTKQHVCSFYSFVGFT